ncbi:MAG: sirohydrochlorin cobaltochelatase, partial [Lacrimispora sp.]
MKRAILAVSFGTSYNESRIKTIEAIEEALRKEFSGYELRRAFTSGMIIEILKNRDGIHIDSVSGAL